VRNVLLSVLGALVIFTALPALATAATKMPQCSGRVVWIVPAQKIYVLSNNPRYGKKPGAYACESTAVARGYRMRPMQIGRPMAHPTTQHPKDPPVPPRAAVVSGENPTLTAIARAQIDILRTGKIDRSQYGKDLNAVMTDQVVTQLSQLFAISGKITAFSYAGAQNVSGLPVTQYVVSFEHPISTPNVPSTNQWIESIATDASGKVVYLSFVPKT